ncbi:MAG: hypothetical protein GWO81_01645 [Verrucomicrobia bacterium]|nr:hypothetical protein [Verrucomicrobiota bacterium]
MIEQTIKLADQVQDDMIRIYLTLLLPIAFQSGIAQVNNTEVMQIVRQYEATQRSTAHPEGINTIIRKGTHNDGDKNFELTQTCKAPHKIRYEYTLDGVKTQIGYSGEMGWRRLQKGDDVSVDDYVAKEYDWLRQSADFKGPLLRALYGEAGIELTLVDTVVIEGRTLRVILARIDGQLDAKYYLNAVSYFLEKVVFLDSEDQVFEENNYGDFRHIEGIALARSVKITGKNGSTATYQWRDLEINPTVYDFFFEKPKF